MHERSVESDLVLACCREFMLQHRKVRWKPFNTAPPRLASPRLASDPLARARL